MLNIHRHFAYFILFEMNKKTRLVTFNFKFCTPIPVVNGLFVVQLQHLDKSCFEFDRLKHIQIDRLKIHRCVLLAYDVPGTLLSNK